MSAPDSAPSAEKADNETCPPLCAESSHPGHEHDPMADGCYCWELCEMGPTCPAANGGLPRGCHRFPPAQEANRD